MSLLAVLLAACGGGGHARSSAPTTTLLKADRWTRPVVPTGPSTENFCTVVVDVYKHMTDASFAATDKVRSQILGDYVAEAPTMVSTAPPQVAAAATVYFGSVAAILGDLQKAGLNGKKITDPRLAQLLLDPKVKAAGNTVIAFVQDNCRYTIGP